MSQNERASAAREKPQAKISDPAVEPVASEAVPAPLAIGTRRAPPDHPTHRTLQQKRLLRQQHHLGNRFVQRRLAARAGVPTIQRDDDDSFSRSIVHQGHTLTDDPTTLKEVVEAVATKKGVAGAAAFASSYASRAGGRSDPNSKESAYWMSVVGKLDQAVANLRTKAKEIESEFERVGLNVISEMLNGSEQKLEAEKERYGLKFEGTKGGSWMSDSTTTPGAPASGPSDVYSIAQNTDTGKMLAAAGELQPLRQELDQLYKDRDALEETVVHNNAGPLPSFRITDQAAHDRLTEQIKDKEPKYNALRAQHEAAFPILAAFTGRGGAASLAAIAASTEGTDLTIGPLIAKQLANIDTVRKAVADGNLVVWDVNTIVRGTQAQLGYAPNSLGFRLTSDAFKAKQKEKAVAKLALAVLQISITLIGAAATRSPGTAAAIARAATSTASTALSAVQAARSLQEYELAKAMNGTDPDKARVISQDAPSLFWLALDLVGFVSDAFAARDAFVALKGPVQSAIIAGSVRATGEETAKVATGSAELAKLREACQPYPGMYEKALAQIGRAEDDPARVMAAIAEEGQAKANAARSAVAERPPSTAGGAVPGLKGTAYQAKLDAASALLQQFQGAIPDIVRKWIAEGKVRPLNRATIMADFSHLPSTRAGEASKSVADDLIADGYLDMHGFYDPPTGRVYVAGTTPEQMTGTLIHEAQHRLKHIAVRNRLLEEGMSLEDAEQEARRALISFESEMMAHIAERDFYLLVFGPGGPRAGEAGRYASDHMRSMMQMSDGQLMSYVQRNYSSSAAAAQIYAQPSDITSLDPYVDQIFRDIATRYQTVPR